MAPLVTITIPTYNSGKFLRRCLESIKEQTYRNIEVNIIDSRSQDDTLDIARQFGVQQIKSMSSSLLQARWEGVKLALGDYILILDSDQILEKGTIKRAIKLAKDEKFDMLALEERPLRTSGFIEKLFDADRKLINTVNDLSPQTGVIMPRFFKADILKKAYRNIPEEVFPNTGGPDHAIVYYEAFRLSQKVGVLPDAVWHMEPASFKQLWKKFYRWGYTSVDAHTGPYKDLMRRKEKFRTGLFTRGLVKESMGSVLLLILKGVPFKLGFYKAKLDIMMGKRR